MKRHLSTLLILCMAQSTFGQPTTKPFNLTLIDSGFLFHNPPFKACHASTIENLSGNRIVAAWFAGNHEGDSAVSIYKAARSEKIWSRPVKVADGKQPDGRMFACWNPVLFKAKNDTLYLHYKVGPNPREWWALYKWSSDGGNTWSEAIPLPEGFLGPIRSKPLQLTGGDILYPSSTESLDEKVWSIHLERSNAHVQDWEMIPLDCDTFQTIQPTLIRHGKDSLQLLARSKENVLVQSWSHDNGRTWERVTRTNVINPNSGVDAVTLKSGTHLLVYNPLASGNDWWNGRSVLKLASSADGINWTDIFTFEDHPEGEYSYPALIATESGDVYVTYTYDRVNIRFFHFKVTR